MYYIVLKVINQIHTYISTLEFMILRFIRVLELLWYSQNLYATYFCATIPMKPERTIIYIVNVTTRLMAATSSIKIALRINSTLDFLNCKQWDAKPNLVISIILSLMRFMVVSIFHVKITVNLLLQMFLQYKLPLRWSFWVFEIAKFCNLAPILSSALILQMINSKDL